MIHIKKIEAIEQLSELKHQYLTQTKAPLDGMWLCGFVSIASHFGFYEDGNLVGYCCVNNDGYLLQFYLNPKKQEFEAQLFDSVLTGKNSSIEKINGAFVSTAEPQYLSLCLDSFPAFKVNALMYQLDEKSNPTQEYDPAFLLTVVRSEQLSKAVGFAKAAVGAPEEWLTGYFSNLVDRQELYGYWKSGRLMATGECRDFVEYQTDYTDLGVIVDESARGKGIATKVLKQLVAIAETKGLKPMCSTEKTNIGAQKAIRRAGFISGNRIIQFDI